MKPTVVFLPGVNNVATIWAPVVEAMAVSVEPVLADVPALTSIDAIASAVVGGLPQQFVLVGHSFGGMVALAILDAFPERVQAIALVASRAGADAPAVAQAKLERAEAARVNGHEDFVLGNGARVFHARFQNDAAILAQRAEDVHAYGTERYIAHNIAMAHRPDRTAVLAAARIPKLIVAPSDDVVIPSDYQRDLAQTVGAEFVVIDQTGHMLPAEDPAALGREIAGWLERVGSTAPLTPQNQQRG